MLRKRRTVINKTDIISQDIALNFISSVALSNSLLEFLGRSIENSEDKNLNLNHDFFQTTLNLLKIHKNKRVVYEYVFECLSKIKYTYKNGQSIFKLKYPSFLVDKIWLKPEWNKFSLYCLRFMEKLTD